MLPAALVLLLVGLAVSEPLARATAPAEGGRIWGYPLFFLAVLVVGGAYLFTARLCRVPEVTAVLAKVRSRVGRGTPPA